MTTHLTAASFHHAQAVATVQGLTLVAPDIRFTYTFQNFFHPWVDELLERVQREGVDGLLDPERLAELEVDDFASRYQVTSDHVTRVVGDVLDIDLSTTGPYAVYNWELGFHVPFTIAVHLSTNQRFAEAQRWFHRIFDPTTRATTPAGPARYWKFLGFRTAADAPRLDELLALLAKPEAQCTPQEKARRAEALLGYQAILDHPFQPYAVARTRVTAFQYAVVMKYLDNLIAWGDSLFVQGTLESVNEATQLYVLAANLLGPKPQVSPRGGRVAARTFRDLRALYGGPLNNPLVELEGQWPFNYASPLPSGGGAAGPLLGVARTLYFCVPPNDRLLRYWDTVADRLYKIRNSLDIRGVFRTLALFDPPIDPALLVRAAAAGLDVMGVVAGLSAPPSAARSGFLLARALEVTGEVKQLGAGLLAAWEKRDAEALALLRQGHEAALQGLARDARFVAWKAAEEATESLLRARTTALERYTAALRPLGLAPDGARAPARLALERRELTEENFDEVLADLVSRYDTPVEPLAYPNLTLAPERPSHGAGVTAAGPLHLTRNEDLQLNVTGPEAKKLRDKAHDTETLFQILSLIPDMGIELAFWGLGGRMTVFGGSLLAAQGRFITDAFNTLATELDLKGAAASTVAGFERRVDDWTTQANLAGHELAQLGRQVIGSLLAEQVARVEYETVCRQLEQSAEVDDLLRSKFTNVELYAWMSGELARLHHEYYRFALELARKAEAAVRRELRRPELDDVTYVRTAGYWDAGRRGLLAGEQLQLDLLRLQAAAGELDTREYELTTHVSLRQVDPVALLTLRTTGACRFTVPETVFVTSTPSVYLRRLRSVAVSVPAVVGSQTGVAARLSLERSSLRVSSTLADGRWSRSGPDDDRFVDLAGGQSIITSTGIADTGTFDGRTDDARPAPFDLAGAIGTWNLTLPGPLGTFDPGTIDDVVLHLRHTAREGGDLLARAAQDELQEAVAEASTSGLTLLVTLQHELATAWGAFAHGDGPLDVELRRDLFPWFTVGHEVVVDELALYGRRTTAAGPALARRTLQIGPGADAEVPRSTLDPLADADGVAVVPVAPDPAVLVRGTSSLVHLLVRYHLA